jgi:hypothetical protein
VKRSRKRSASSEESKRLDRRIFFVDRSLGRHVLANKLRAAGLRVEAHDDHFSEDTPDEVWLAEAGRRGWVVLTADKRIRSRRLERETLIEAGVQALFLPSKNLRLEEIGDAIGRSTERLLRFLDANSAPLLARLGRDGRPEILARRRALRKKHGR